MPNYQRIHFETSTPNYPTTQEALYGSPSPSHTTPTPTTDRHAQQADDFHDSLDHNKNHPRPEVPNEAAKNKVLERKAREQEKDERKADGYYGPLCAAPIAGQGEGLNRSLVDRLDLRPREVVLTWWKWGWGWVRVFVARWR